MNAGTAEVGTVKARKVAHTTARALVECAGLPVAVPQFAPQGDSNSGVNGGAKREPDGRALPSAIFEFGPLRLTPGWLGDVKSGRRIAVTQVQMQILQGLVAAGGAAVNQDALMRGRTWGGRETRRAVSVHITALRRKMRDIRTAATIHSHPRLGYSIAYPGMGVVQERDSARGTAQEAA